ncbi:MAG: S49 family peptidase [Betaproteobacteria bacterium]|jgi:protease-4|nr:S49 family peptidase [Rhodocyclaceae bacterium]MCA3134950.1 S49 family peptidase [Rhodocyclaceae bacterium]MCA3143787.1 S49 family peptidase [Rhodocyclaceae bacterium]MCA3147060.1 S49 family peptidase [Rhodocyclaceae bacterium]MCE2898025.1 S49 family peptidase [Betaproteobacteria bacterium]
MAQPETPDGAPEAEPWEREALRKLAQSALDEQRRARRWGILFKSLGFGYLFVVLFVALGWIGQREAARSGKHTALVQINGVIDAEGAASAEVVASGLKEAFEDKNTEGVIVRINSPGGSPVQSDSINAEMRRLRGKHPAIPLYVVVDDICASGGYYVAVAADKIFVSKGSLVGSIGVLMDGFGFTGAMEKLGVERRLLTAGANKGFLDPFSPLNPQQRAHAERMLGEIHQQFIDAVRSGRGTRLKETQDTFSGLIWTGERSVELGLADAIGDAAYVAREVIKAENIVDFTPRENLAERFAKRFGAATAQALLSAGASETRARLR